mmetsp:Transcript_13008/g.27524  ORF Transcript_13008/g.27524 Transcript_13008/m.27524 type:complete len:230 (-) Transcript_13008:486-1175(-)
MPDLGLLVAGSCTGEFSHPGTEQAPRSRCGNDQREPHGQRTVHRRPDRHALDQNAALDDAGRGTAHPLAAERERLFDQRTTRVLPPLHETDCHQGRRDAGRIERTRLLPDARQFPALLLRREGDTRSQVCLRPESDCRQVPSQNTEMVRLSHQYFCDHWWGIHGSGNDRRLPGSDRLESAHSTVCLECDDDDVLGFVHWNLHCYRGHDQLNNERETGNIASHYEIMKRQ